jgi:hypothetical protein
MVALISCVLRCSFEAVRRFVLGLVSSWLTRLPRILEITTHQA